MVDLITAILLQGYWLSVPVIGYAVLRFSSRRLKLGKTWEECPFLAKFLISVGVGFFIFALITIVMYAFQLSSWILVGLYICLLLFAAYSLFFSKDMRIDIMGCLKARQWVKVSWVMWLLMTLLAFDYVYSMWVGGYLQGDGVVHISKIRHIVENGFTLTDAYFGATPETRHHINITHTLYAIPSRMGIDPVNVWYFSLAFFRLLKWISIFLLAWVVARIIKPAPARIWASFATVFGLLLLSGSYTIQYPGNYVAVWMVLFIVGCANLISNRSVWLAVVGATLIAFTHPLASMAACMLLILLSMGLLLFDRGLLNRRVVMGFILCGALLLSTPIFTQLLPNQMTEFAKNYGMERYEFYDIGPLTARAPSMPDSKTEIVIAAISAIGYVFLLIKLRLHKTRTVFYASSMFLVLLLYNPFVYTVLERVLPAWAIQRLGVANQVSIIVLFFGVLALALVIKKWLTKRVSLYVLVALALVCMFIFLQSFNHMPKSEVSVHDMNASSREIMRFEKDVLLPKDKHVVVFDDIYRSFLYPAASQVYVLAILESSATPAADMVERSRCYHLIKEELQPALLKQAGIEYVLAWHNEPLYKLAEASPYLHKDLTVQAPQGMGTVSRYKVDLAAIKVKKVSACSFKEK